LRRAASLAAGIPGARFVAGIEVDDALAIAEQVDV
jgi:hypothetical protein